MHPRSLGLFLRLNWKMSGDHFCESLDALVQGVHRRCSAVEKARVMNTRQLQIRAYLFLHDPIVRKIVYKLPVIRRVYGRHYNSHPIDRLYGIDTGGFVPTEELNSSLATKISPYLGSQPFIVRRALAALPKLADYSFVDLGCGKGRAMIIAAEYPFREIIGVEISPNLARIARSNAEKMKGNLPSSSKIQIIEGDATKFRPQGERIVFFTYHAFGIELMREFLKNLEAGLGRTIEHCFFVYYNPVCGSVFDASSALAHWFADTIPYDSSEIGFGPDIADGVAIWQSVHNANHRPWKSCRG
jgi:SAM-dependent methyltransferase